MQAEDSVESLQGQLERCMRTAKDLEDENNGLRTEYDQVILYFHLKLVYTHNMQVFYRNLFSKIIGEGNVQERSVTSRIRRISITGYY